MVKRDILSMAARNLLRRKSRTFLTMLGVLIGTTSIVVMVSLGIGLQEAQKARGEKPTNLIDSKEYDLIAESDAAQDAVDAIIHPRKH